MLQQLLYYLRIVALCQLPSPARINRGGSGRRSHFQFKKEKKWEKGRGKLLHLARFIWGINSSSMQQKFCEDFAGPKPPYDGQVLRVIGFKPRYVNQVEVRDAQGRRGLLPLDMVEKALRLEGKLSDENSSIPEVQFCNDWCCAQSWSMPIR